MRKVRRRRHLNPKIAKLFEGAATIAGLFILAWLLLAM